MESGREREYSIGELAEAAGISTRTIRYYVAEGLLPPPAGAGPNSRYTDTHLEQLTLIGRLKEQYLPLKEIRRRLIGHNVPEAPAQRAASISPSSPPRQPSAHVHRLLGRALAESVPATEASDLAYSLPEAGGVNWRRISITGEAELVITEEQYERHRDKIDWLVQWATRVLE